VQHLSHIKNIVFDLGGVIIDLDFAGALNAFSNLSGLPVEEVKNRTKGFMLFTEYEKGQISSDGFRDQIRQILQIQSTDDQIDQAWNALLGGIPKERVELLQFLKPKFNTFALSNTNEIHVREFSSIVSQSMGSVDSFMELFHEVYFSHEMKMRKPDAEIYETVLNGQDLLASETLFIDDNRQNIESAANLGIHTHHLLDANSLTNWIYGA